MQRRVVVVAISIEEHAAAIGWIDQVDMVWWGEREASARSVPRTDITRGQRVSAGHVHVHIAAAVSVWGGVHVAVHFELARRTAHLAVNSPSPP